MSFSHQPLLQMLQLVYSNITFISTYCGGFLCNKSGLKVHIQRNHNCDIPTIFCGNFSGSVHCICIHQIMRRQYQYDNYNVCFSIDHIEFHPLWQPTRSSAVPPRWSLTLCPAITSDRSRSKQGQIAPCLPLHAWLNPGSATVPARQFVPLCRGSSTRRRRRKRSERANNGSASSTTTRPFNYKPKREW